METDKYQKRSKMKPDTIVIIRLLGIIVRQLANITEYLLLVRFDDGRAWDNLSNANNVISQQVDALDKEVGK